MYVQYCLTTTCEQRGVPTDLGRSLWRIGEAVGEAAGQSVPTDLGWWLGGVGEAAWLSVPTDLGWPLGSVGEAAEQSEPTDLGWWLGRVGEAAGQSVPTDLGWSLWRVGEAAGQAGQRLQRFLPLTARHHLALRLHDDQICSHYSRRLND